MEDGNSGRWSDSGPGAGFNETTIATKIWVRGLHEGREQHRRQFGWFGRVEIVQIHDPVSWQEHLGWLELERDAGSEPGLTSWPEALLKWARSDERVDVVIPATTNPAHARERTGSPPWFVAEQRRPVERLAG